MLKHIALFAVVGLSFSQSASAASTLIVSGDEWQLTDSAFQAPFAITADALATDIATIFGGTNYLLLSGNINVPSTSLTGLSAKFASLDKTVSLSTTLPVDLSGFDAIFHFGQVISQTVIADYVNGGGNAFISLGGGRLGNSLAEANYWNPTLASFGLVAGTQWFTTATATFSSITQGPGNGAMYWRFGQSIEVLPDSANASSYVRGSLPLGPTNIGLLGISRPTVGGGSTVPEPASWAMLIAGFGLIGAAMRRRNLVAI